ncbi:peptidase M48 Ste24p [Candidatus Magnetoovum chiemensis]|nr:peptidase M48 Ste24p [Candidatus Magnetoovum chiemensis]
MMRRNVFALSVILLTVFLTSSVYGECKKQNKNYQDDVEWWASEYNVVEGKDNPLVKRAERVFERLTAAADEAGHKKSRLLVIEQGLAPDAQSIKDGSVIITTKTLDVCYEKGVSEDTGDSRLAFILGHELAHIANKDFWHADAFIAN